MADVQTGIVMFAALDCHGDGAFATVHPACHSHLTYGDIELHIELAVISLHRKQTDHTGDMVQW